MRTQPSAVQRAGLNWQQFGPRVAGAGLLAATAAIHLDLYLTGYQTIPVIGWLFLLQVIAGFGLTAALLASGSRAVAAAGGGIRRSDLGRLPVVRLGRLVRVH